jgi:uncharacterized protein (DUF1330 family)
MSAYFVVTYDIADKQEYAKYNPGSNHITASTVAKHGGELIAAANDCIRLSGTERQMKVIIKFPNSEAAEAWHADPEYADAKHIRMNSTTNINAFIIDGLSD